MKLQSFKIIILSIITFLAASLSAIDNQPSFDTQRISQITGIKGIASDEGVFKLSVPREDTSILVDGWKLPPFMGVTSWVAFMKGRQQEVMLMGDLVLFQDEVNPVMDVILKGGLEVTALHNHFFYDQPKVYFMHVSGEGNIQDTAETIKNIFEKVKEIRNRNKQPAATFGAPKIALKSQISQAPLDEIFGQKGQNHEGMFKVVIGRQASMSCGCKIGKEMGLNTWAAFAGTDDHAVVDGDFAVLEEELQAVLKTLRNSGINIVAIHHHMVGESPKYYFLHYWGIGKAKDLAQAIKRALEGQSLRS